jgi:hypothetical protein
MQRPCLGIVAASPLQIVLGGGLDARRAASGWMPPRKRRIHPNTTTFAALGFPSQPLPPDRAEHSNLMGIRANAKCENGDNAPARPRLRHKPAIASTLQALPTVSSSERTGRGTDAFCTNAGQQRHIFSP